MGINIELTGLAMFAQGILSFFTPFVIPIIPLYILYLSAGALNAAGEEDEVGTCIEYNLFSVFINTIFFVLGINCAFIILTINFSSIGKFLLTNQAEFRRLGGLCILMLGVFQVGTFDVRAKTLNHEDKKLSVQALRLQMNPGVALIIGFILSFAWTPYVGSILTSIIIMISSTRSVFTGIVLMVMYTLGFAFPFIVIGTLTTYIFNIIDRKKDVIIPSTKLAGAIMGLMGVFMMTGLTDQLENHKPQTNFAVVDEVENRMYEALNVLNDVVRQFKHTIANARAIPREQEVKAFAKDFCLLDQYGFTHTLEQYKGKIVFLNFLATWCDQSVYMMKEVQDLYEAYGYNANDIVVLSIVAPQTEQNPFSKDLELADMKKFIKNKTVTYPVMFDLSGDITRSYMLEAYPATVMIDTDGDVFGYVPDTLTLEMMVNVIDQTVAHSEVSDLIEYLPAWMEEDNTHYGRHS
ncbi:MAG: hypothetical protein BEN18_07185 [Epulopiscium sp. Nuni2H_MBin001]|nr:MAG: hypothetical protein BEN18_07185 [Epulopiscium sp. Nuni2H_MBin001]